MQSYNYGIRVGKRSVKKIDPIKILDQEIRAAGSISRFAAAENLSRQFIYDVLQGRREFTPRLCDAIGLEMTVKKVKTVTFKFKGVR